MREGGREFIVKEDIIVFLDRSKWVNSDIEEEEEEEDDELDCKERKLAIFSSFTRKHPSRDK